MGFGPALVWGWHLQFITANVFNLPKLRLLQPGPRSAQWRKAVPSDMAFTALHSLDLDPEQNQFNNSQIFVELLYYYSASVVFLHIAMPTNLHIKAPNNTTVKNNNSKASIPESLFTSAFYLLSLLTQA